MVKIKMWEIRGKNSKHYFTKNYRSVEAAKEQVRKWNQFDNPYDRIGIAPRQKFKKKRENPYALRSLSGRLL